LQSTRTRASVIVAGAILVAVVAVGLVSLAGSLGGKHHGAATPRKTRAVAAAAGGAVDVRLSDFKISPSSSYAKAGKVEFVARNVGSTKHEMVVVRTDRSAGSLLKGDEASEAGAVDEIGEFAPGLTKRLTLNLKPGHYALICNAPGHYKAGMFKNFVVR
jgi:uncharacterized cupredoxin-like copper-binding protein